MQPERIDPRIQHTTGDLYVHRVVDDSGDPSKFQVWIFSEAKAWESVALTTERHHPILRHLVLLFSKRGTPSWVKPSTAKRHTDPPMLHMSKLE